MKKIITILLTLVLVLSLSACGERQAPSFSGVEDITINVGDVFKVMEGVKALDQDGNDITDKVTFQNKVNPSKAGEYSVIYEVTDSKGAYASVERIVTVVKVDREGPSISGVGDKEIVIGSTFSLMEGVSANDTIDGECEVTCEGKVDTYTPGEYKLVYKSHDSKNNESVVERTITVTLGAFRFNDEEKVEDVNLVNVPINTLEYKYGVIKVIIESDTAQSTQVKLSGAVTANRELKAGVNEIYMRYIRNAISDNKETENINGTITATAGTIKGYIIGVPSDITPPIFKLDAKFTIGDTIYLPKALQGVDMTEEQVIKYIKDFTGIRAFDVRDNKYPDIYVKEIDMSVVDSEQIVVLAAQDDTGNEGLFNQKVVLVSELLAMDSLNPREITYRKGAYINDTYATDTIDTICRELANVEALENSDADSGFDLVLTSATNMYYEDKIQYLLGSEFTYGKYYMLTISAKSTNADFYSTMRIYQGISTEPWSDYYGGYTKDQIVFNSEEYTTYNFIFKYDVQYEKTKYFGPIVEWDVAASQSYGANALDNILHVKSFILYAISGQELVTSPYTGDSGNVTPSIYPIRDLRIEDGKIEFTERVTNATKYEAEIYNGSTLVKTVEIHKGDLLTSLNLDEGIYDMKVRYYIDDVVSTFSNQVSFTIENEAGTLGTKISGNELQAKINLMGRVDTNDDGSINLYYTASGFRVNFTGTKLRATFSTVDNKSLGAGYIVVMVDGELYPEHGSAIALDKGDNGEYTLCLGLENKAHTVEVLKRSEASNNTFILKSLSTDGSFGDAPADRDIKILAIGASGSTGYGNLNTQSQTPKNSDGMRAFPYLVARVLNADITEVNASGWGLIWGWNDTNGNSNLYTAFQKQAILPNNTQMSKAFDFTTDDDYDLIIVNFGINDYSVHISKVTDATQKAQDVERYRQRFADFLSLLHEKYPKAIIISVNDDITVDEGLINKQVIESQFSSFAYEVKIPANGVGTSYGSNSHANVQTHVWSADAILDFLKESSYKDKFVEVNARLVYDSSRDQLNG